LTEASEPLSTKLAGKRITVEPAGSNAVGSAVNVVRSSSAKRGAMRARVPLSSPDSNAVT
jgi:hypothetical protein